MLPLLIAKTLGGRGPRDLPWLKQCANSGCRIRNRRLDTTLNRSSWIRFEEKWFCSVECMQAEIVVRVHGLLLPPTRQVKPASHRIPLGLILLSRNLITAEQLSLALALQRSDPAVPIGSHLKRLGALYDFQIASAVASQWSCPAFPEDKTIACKALLPKTLQEKYRALAVHWTARTNELYVGFTQRVNYSLLFAIERILLCTARPVIITDASFQRALGADGDLENEVLFTALRPASEIVSSITSYCEQTGARELRLAGCDGDIWARLYNAHGVSLDLVYLDTVS